MKTTQKIVLPRRTTPFVGLSIFVFGVFAVAMWFGLLIGIPYLLGTGLTHLTGWSMRVTVPIAIVFLFATGIFRFTTSRKG